jgi:two-component system chemotaxis sensor kinase CheA
LRVEDDGRGLDPEKLRQVAMRKGLLSPQEAAALSDTAARDLIFLAGFSSKDAATELSGRGVGLDVVRVRMVALGGEATVDSSVGKGSAFEVRVPVSLTVAPLLFIEVGEERLCLTASNVDRALKIEANTTRELAGRPAISVEDSLVPFASISSILGAAPERPPTEGELVLVVKGRGQAAAIAVDRVLEERVQAVLPLKGVLSSFQHLSGATALADGRLAMVLSAAHLVAMAQGSRARLVGTGLRVPEAKKRRILVVDDSPLTRELLSGLLEAVGFEIVNSNDGVEAMERLGREAVDLVVTDLEMPRMDGLELTRRLKSHPTLSSLPVVIVTTRGSEADKRRGMEAGADGYVTKGDLVRQDLVDVVSRLLV